jgi:hypothetical protein
VEIVTDADNKVESVTEIRPNGERFAIYDPKALKNP